MKEKRICIISFSPIQWDGRVLRQIEIACSEYLVDVYGYGEWAPPWKNVNFYDVGPKQSPRIRNALQGLLLVVGYMYPRIRDLTFWYRLSHQRACKLIHNKRYDLIHANDLNALPVAVEVSKVTGAKVLFDAHEYSPDQRTDTLKGKLRSPYASYLLREFGSGIDHLVTVSSGLAQLYKELLGLDADVVMNAPARIEVQPRPVQEGEIQLVYHGNALKGRGLEILIEATGWLAPRFYLNFILVGEDPRYIRKIRRMAEKIAPERIRFYDPVPPSEIVSYLTRFDVGVFVLPPSNLNYRYVLPNKFFDFVGAGLAIAIGPSPEMAELVRKYDMGIVAPGFTSEDIALSLNRLTTENINRMKMNAITASHELNAEIEQKKLLDVYEGLLS